jgi:hypothetical protein
VLRRGVRVDLLERDQQRPVEVLFLEPRQHVVVEDELGARALLDRIDRGLGPRDRGRREHASVVVDRLVDHGVGEWRARRRRIRIAARTPARVDGRGGRQRRVAHRQREELAECNLQADRGLAAIQPRTEFSRDGASFVF